MDDFQARSAAQAVTEYLVAQGARTYFAQFDQLLASLYRAEVDLAPVMRARRLIAAALRFKLRHERDLIDAQLRAIALCEEEPVDAARLHQAMVEVHELLPAARFPRNWSWRAEAVLASLETDEERRAFTHAVKYGEFVERDGAFEYPNKNGRLVLAFVVPCAVLGYLLYLTHLLSQRPSMDTVSITLQFIMSLGASAWIARVFVRGALQTRALHARISSPNFGKSLIKR